MTSEIRKSKIQRKVQSAQEEHEFVNFCYINTSKSKCANSSRADLIYVT